MTWPEPEKIQFGDRTAFAAQDTCPPTSGYFLRREESVDQVGLFGGQHPNLPPNWCFSSDILFQNTPK